MKARFPEATILVVEDDPDDIYLIKRAVDKSRLANPIRFVRDGEEALSYLRAEGWYSDREAHPLPFLIFLDLHMPRVDGFEVLRWIKSRPELHQIKVVVLTSSAAERDYAQAMQLGAHSYFVKPGGLEEFVQLMLRIQGHWLLIDGGGQNQATTEAFGTA